MMMKIVLTSKNQIKLYCNDKFKKIKTEFYEFSKTELFRKILYSFKAYLLYVSGGMFYFTMCLIINIYINASWSVIVSDFVICYSLSSFFGIFVGTLAFMKYEDKHYI